MNKFKSLLTILFTALTMQVLAASVTIGWIPSTDTDVISYNVYYKLSTANTWSVTNVLDRSSTNVTIPVVRLALYQYYVTYVVTNNSLSGPLESDPSNLIRFQSLYVMGTKLTSVKISDVSSNNLPFFTIVKNATKGVLTGTPPILNFTPSVNFDIDVIAYKNPEIFSEQNITNYYALEKYAPIPITINSLIYNK